jgi:hypothetical protein
VDPDPDPHKSALIWLSWIRIHTEFGMRIRIQEHGNSPKFTNKPGFLPQKPGHDPDPPLFALVWLPIRIRIEKKMTDSRSALKQYGSTTLL